MRECKLSTARGKQIFKMGCSCGFSSLRNLYDRWSPEKENAFNRCWEQYLNDENSSAFGVGNANSFGFTASWLLTKDGEDCMRVETRNNSYLLYLER